MPLQGKYPRSKTRDMEVPQVQGNATRYYGDNTNFPTGGTGQKSRGEARILKFPSNAQPKTAGKLKVKNP